MKVFGPEDVRAVLSYPRCIEAVRGAMIALSRGRTRQLLRSIIPLAEGRAFGIMPGALGPDGVFGAKLISVSPANPARGLRSHQGVIVLFDPESGAAACCVDAGEVTAIRTAAASAVATAALALAGAGTLAILGTGEQARSHARAIACVRQLRRVRIWGRSPERARDLARELGSELACEVVACQAEEAVRGADIVCAVTGSPTPVVFSDWVEDGAHVNAVGSSGPGPVEIEPALVARARFIADHRDGVLAQGAEFLAARTAGLIDDGHIVAEIGEVLAGDKPGRLTDRDVTLYKSLGHVVQDLAAAQLVQEAAAG
ncbi:MAG: ornithine cyclodeaminase family protein [Caulobacteraceae bacterium]